jgi:hypothetical protein
VGGEPVESTVTRSNDQLVIAAGDMSATISGVTADGAVAPLDNDGNIRLSEGDQIQVEASGFAPNSDVEVWLFSTPTLLGTVTVILRVLHQRSLRCLREPRTEITVWR